MQVQLVMNQISCLHEMMISTDCQPFSKYATLTTRNLYVFIFVAKHSHFHDVRVVEYIDI